MLKSHEKRIEQLTMDQIWGIASPSICIIHSCRVWGGSIEPYPGYPIHWSHKFKAIGFERGLFKHTSTSSSLVVCDSNWGIQDITNKDNSDIPDDQKTWWNSGNFAEKKGAVRKVARPLWSQLIEIFGHLALKPFSHSAVSTAVSTNSDRKQLPRNIMTNLHLRVVAPTLVFYPKIIISLAFYCIWHYCYFYQNLANQPHTKENYFT